MINPCQITPHDPKDFAEDQVAQQIIREAMGTPEGRAVEAAIAACALDLVCYSLVSPEKLAALKKAQDALYDNQPIHPKPPDPG